MLIDAYLLIVVIGCSQSNNACVRLAAAKAVLRLSRRWDLHICPETFYFTISLTKVCWVGSIQKQARGWKESCIDSISIASESYENHLMIVILFEELEK